MAISGRKPVAEETIRPEDSQTVPWDEAGRRLADAGTFWLTTMDQDGRPHSRPLLAVLVDGALHFVSSTSARKWNNLERSSRCSISTSTDGLDLVVEGDAVRVIDDKKLQRVASAYESKYQWTVEIRDGAFHAEGAPTAGPPPFHIYEVLPSKVFGFGTDETHGNHSTRWRF